MIRIRGCLQESLRDEMWQVACSTFSFSSRKTVTHKNFDKVEMPITALFFLSNIRKEGTALLAYKKGHLLSLSKQKLEQGKASKEQAFVFLPP
ncbi:hypothetical protein EZV62_010004 [Acer yangbiense]|uniref:Uncharacterized protein n=1 Tax=Acer yangbiense TaxID=1000413 RepID=A0A5C7I1I5_9ROSI|nr:hypothetical protein EZV62_010004 [Acer yangbiense]